MKINAKILVIYCVIVIASFGLMVSSSMSSMGNGHYSLCPFSRLTAGVCSLYGSMAAVTHHLSEMQMLSFAKIDFFKDLFITFFIYLLLLYLYKVFSQFSIFTAGEIQKNSRIFLNKIFLQFKKIMRWFSLLFKRDPFAQIQARKVLVL